mmetsp:Transcript_55204/g.64596  ORF Transcript_55204/g.64596 Transcript_55204/m.64596 type:complete len:174 (-) Transcript_55204:457-978(-)
MSLSYRMSSSRRKRNSQLNVGDDGDGGSLLVNDLLNKIEMMRLDIVSLNEKTKLMSISVDRNTRLIRSISGDDEAHQEHNSVQESEDSLKETTAPEDNPDGLSPSTDQEINPHLGISIETVRNAILDSNSTNDDTTVAHFEEDTYSLMMISPIFSKPWLVGLVSNILLDFTIL